MVSPVRRLVLLGAVLAGLFALHGLGDHGADEPHVMAHLAGSAAPHADAGVTSAQPSAMAGMTGGCLAFLGLLLLGLRRRDGRGEPLAAVPSQPCALGRTGSAVERAPPPFELLSVRRC